MVQEETYKWIQARLREIDSGALSEKDLARLRDIAREDPFVADALEGFHAHPDVGHTEHFSAIEEKINIQKLPRRRWLVPNLTVTVIAAVFLLLIAGYAVIMRIDNAPSETTFVFVEPDSLLTLDSTSGAIAMESNRESYAGESEIQPSSPVIREEESDREQDAAKENATIAKQSSPDIIAAASVPESKKRTTLQDETKASSPSYQIEGTITDVETNSPLSFSPYLVGFSNKLSFTDADGKFRIEAPVQDFVINVKHKGYKENTVLISASEETQVINLTPIADQSLQSLADNEAADVAYQTPDKSTVAYFAFRNYIVGSTTLPLGTGMSDDGHIVTVRFFVGSDGRPQQVKVTHSSGQNKYDKEAIRLVESGPDWVCKDGLESCMRSYTFYFQ